VYGLIEPVIYLWLSGAKMDKRRYWLANRGLAVVFIAAVLLGALVLGQVWMVYNNASLL
jgi:hypothetical protein